MTENALVELKAVHKVFHKGKIPIEVLQNLDLTINTGEFTALMGPSGSGKTTLLNLLGGLDTPSSGTVIVNGSNLGALRSSQLCRWRSENIGFIFQFYNLMPHLNAQQNVELPLMLLPLSKKQRKTRALTALEIVGLKDRAGHRPAELSGGQEQRVAIARALVSDPQLLLADEPTGDLDRDTAVEILNLMSILNKDHGKTILMVTHDPQAAESSSRVIQLDKGQVI